MHILMYWIGSEPWSLQEHLPYSHVYVAGYLPCDPNEGDLLAATVVDQRHAHIL